MNPTIDNLATLDQLSTHGLNISHNTHVREGKTLDQAVEDLRKSNHLGPKQAVEILEAKNLIVVTSYCGPGFYKAAGATLDSAVERALKNHRSELAIW